MKQITSITNEPYQQHQLVLDNNETVLFTLRFLPRQQAWYFDFTYNEITARRLKVVLTPNALRCFRRIIPFGIAFSSNGYVEPFQLNDFSSGRLKLYVLNSEDVLTVESEIYQSE